MPARPAGGRATSPARPARRAARRWRLGEERLVDDDQTIRFGSVRYSTPPGHVGSKVWCRVVGEELAIVARTGTGLVEIARHRLSTPGNPRIVDEHYPHHPGGNLPRPPKARPRTTAEVAFLDIGDGAHDWLVEAGAAGAQRIRAKMARAVELATILGAQAVDQALGLAAIAGRFDDDDLGSILDHLAGAGAPGDLVHADETHSAQPGTRSWESVRPMSTTRPDDPPLPRRGRRAGRPAAPARGLAPTQRRGHPRGDHRLLQRSRQRPPRRGRAGVPARQPRPHHRLPAQGDHPVTPSAPPIPDELDRLLRRMRLPYLRAAAPDVLATAKAQRWDPAEVLRVLINEEVIGRDAATRRMRRKTANFPTGKTLATWRPDESSIPEATQNALSTLEWIGPRREPRRRRTVRHRQVPLRRSPGPRRDRERPAGRLVHPGNPDRHHRPGQGRRVHRPHRGPDLPQRS